MSNQSANNKRIELNDVYIIRPIAIFVLVVYHAFCIYNGSWREPNGFENIQLYSIIAALCSAFRLELLVFVSGYLFALTLLRKKTSLKSILTSKFERLIIPSIIFSAIYYFMFLYPNNFKISNCVYKILTGTGHMWYLPMLYWTMLICYIIDKIKISTRMKLFFVCFLPMISILPFPFQINRALYYTLFFYIGMIIFRNKELIINKLTTFKNINLAVILFLLSFLIGFCLRNYIISNILTDVDIISKALFLTISTYIKVGYCVLGIFWIYLLVNYLIEKKIIKVSQRVINLSSLCFGIYLFQQFILQYLYYKTDFPSIVGPYWLPWGG